MLTRRAGYPAGLTWAEQPGAAAGERVAAGTGAGAPQVTDAEIMALSRRDSSSFGLIFERHADEILRYAHARLGPDLAEDVLAETFLAAFRQRGRYDCARADARPWLYGIAIRQIGRHRRADLRSRRALARLPAETVTGDIGDRSADRVTAQQLRPCLVRALSGLSRQDRELLLLIAWAGLTYEEAAQALGLTVSAVRSRLHRLRVQIRRALGGANPAAAILEAAGDE